MTPTYILSSSPQKRTESYDKEFGGKWGIRQLKLHLMALHGVPAVNTLFYEIQSLILRSLLSVQQVRVCVVADRRSIGLSRPTSIALTSTTYECNDRRIRPRGGGKGRTIDVIQSGSHTLRKQRKTCSRSMCTQLRGFSSYPGREACPVRYFTQPYGSAFLTFLYCLTPRHGTSKCFHAQLT